LNRSKLPFWVCATTMLLNFIPPLLITLLPAALPSPVPMCCADDDAVFCRRV